MALTLDINAAIACLNKNAGPASKHQCAKYVRMALEAGGMDTSKRPSAAKNYHLQGYLNSIGFQQYQPQYGGNGGYQTINAKPGDIEVQVYEPYGHICMYNGTIWVSDFRQEQASASKSRQGQGQYYYRFTGEITNSTIPADNEGSGSTGGAGGSGSGNGFVRLKVNWGGALKSGADYPANAKLTTTGWEVKGREKSDFNPFASVQKFNTLEKKSETIMTAAPSETNFNHIKIKGETLNETTNNILTVIDTDISNVNQTILASTNDLMTTIASGNIDPNDYRDLLQKTAMNFRSLWDADKYMGILEAFSFNCPVCGKKVRFIPVNGYCSLNCFLADMKSQLLSVKNSITSQLKKFTDSNIGVVKNYLQMCLSMVNDLPGAMEDLELVSDSVQSYIQTRYNYLANKQKYFINRILIWKNNLLIAWLKEYLNGVARTDKLNDEEPEPTTNTETEENTGAEKTPEIPQDQTKSDSDDLGTIEITDNENSPDASLNSKKDINDSINEAFTWIDSNIDKIGSEFLKNQKALDNINELSRITQNIQTILQYKDKFYELYDEAYKFINKNIKMVVPSDSFGFMGTTRSIVKNPAWPDYIDISCPASVKYSYPEKSKLYKSKNKRSASRPQLDRIKKLCDKVINYTFPPIQDFEYLMEPELFATRLIFSDQNFVAIAKNIAVIFNMFKGEPELLPEYKDLTITNIWYIWALYKGIVPTIQFTYGKIAPPGVEPSLAVQSDAEADQPVAQNTISIQEDTTGDNFA